MVGADNGEPEPCPLQELHHSVETQPAGIHLGPDKDISAQPPLAGVRPLALPAFPSVCS
ncbi:hypothetical protein GCM10011509_33250 [Ornithinimicrobium pekingense]|uniref:Uncharacterized protein n=1 Tax=Ornithinimicrobium pekingense TaxID=384677 RepID=A0ABQ2FDM4_9MICO|nr:hypothetical protein GCM10011509_33250 [Ornithinimicrobium pekingense]